MSNTISPFTNIDATQIYWRKHALQRMLERSLTRSDVKEAIVKGIVIEEYRDDAPFPSCLIAYIAPHQPLHVVVSFDKEANALYVITAYVPDTLHFEEDLITRRTHG